jgi:hypothetical protein
MDLVALFTKQLSDRCHVTSPPNGTIRHEICAKEFFASFLRGTLIQIIAKGPDRIAYRVA